MVREVHAFWREPYRANHTFGFSRYQHCDYAQMMRLHAIFVYSN